MGLFWISCVAAGCSLACVAYLALMAGGRRVARWQAPVAEALENGDFAIEEVGVARPFSGGTWRYARPWLRLCGRALMPLLSWRVRTALMRQLQGADMAVAWDVQAAVGLLACAAIGGGAVAALCAVSWIEQPATRLGIMVCAILGGALAAAWLLWHHIRDLAARRRQTMLREFPFLLDLMTLCVEAGLNLHGALRQAAHHGPPGPLRQELRLALNAIRAGHARHQALDAMAARCDLPALVLWVAAVHQADRLGMSLGPLLRAQSAQQRSDRFLRAETLALQAPVRLLFPLVTCMFPCAFLVIGFPIATLLLQALQ